MLQKIKADFKKHWISWAGFVGLGIIGGSMFVVSPHQVIMAVLMWALVVWGMSLGAAVDKYEGHRSSEEINGPYK